MLKKSILFFFLSFAPILNVNAMPAYTHLDKTIPEAPEVVEFFSFYCPPCYQFVDNYPVSKRLNHMLPEGVTVKKYHVSAMGKMGKELTEAWAIATTMGIADEIEKPLFIAIQQHRTIDNLDAIKNLFVTVGIAPQAYENARRSFSVRAMVEQQEKMAERFSVQSTPTFYVKGTYRINNNGFKATNPNDYVKMFTQQVMLLVNEDNL